MPTEDGCIVDTSADYGSWLKSYLSRLSSDLDVDVLSDYITGLLDCLDSPKSEVISEVEGLLSEYLGNNVSHSSAVEIVQRFSQSESNGDHPPSADHDALQSIEERMRALVQADFEQHQAQNQQPTEAQPRDRDVCTTAVLRECGAAGYQGDSEEEKEAEIAITNAEFEAKQRIEMITGGRVTDGATWSTTADKSDSEEEIDLDELEDAIGYSKKENAKPGTVQDALSILNPSLFGSAGVPQSPVAVSTVPGAKPGRSLLTGSSASVTIVNRSRTQEIDAETSNRAERKKKKAPAISKHLARVGAQAEAKQSKGDKLAGRNRLDQMDAFLSSDSEGEPASASLPEGGHNRERVIQTEQTARQNQANMSAQRRLEEKANRAKQLEQANQRKEAAQKRTQKQERRR